jgi:DNA invertase Pin-like site-specific DNA recombinase
MSGTSQRFVAYERVSTRRQGLSGLGLAAQRKAIDDFAASRAAEVIARFTEVESGKLADRPELAKALAPRQGHRRGAAHRQARPAVA